MRGERRPEPVEPYRGSREHFKKSGGSSTRRGLIGVTIAAVLGGAMYKAGWLPSDIAAFTERVSASGNEEGTASRLQEIQESILFESHFNTFTEEYAGADLQMVLEAENGRAVTIHDPQGLSRIDYLQTHIMEDVSNNQIPQVIRNELMFYLPGLPAVESRYRNDQTSEVGARRIVQIMDSTRIQYGYTHEQMAYFRNQVSFMREYFIRAHESINRVARTPLQKIKQEYFGNDEVAFQKQFMTLVLINSYQAGDGTMCNVLREFADRPISRGADGRPRLRGHDVFAAMTDAAADGGFDPDYREDSSEYAKRVVAFAFLVNGSNTSAIPATRARGTT